MTTHAKPHGEPGSNTDASVPVGGAVGRPVDRRDGHAKVTGTALFSAEHRYPNLTYATMVHATIARGTITGIDTAAAAAVPGVLAVLTHLNAPRIRPERKANIIRDLGPSISGTAVDYLNTDQVFWDGQPIAVVIAENSAAANEAAPLVTMTYREVPARVDFAVEQKNATVAKGDLTFAGVAKKVTPTRRWPPRKSPSTCTTPRPACNTTRSNRTRRPPPGTATTSPCTTPPSPPIRPTSTSPGGSACRHPTSGCGPSSSAAPSAESSPSGPARSSPRWRPRPSGDPCAWH